MHGCLEHDGDVIQGFCRDCGIGICFKCAIGKHRQHNIANLEEVSKTDLMNQINVFDVKVDQLRERAAQVLEKAKN